MKIILFCLSFYLIPNFISAFIIFNGQPHDQVNDASNIYHPTSDRQAFEYQQQVHSHDTTDNHQQANTIDDTMNRVIQQHRFQLERNKFSPQHFHLDTTQVNPIINDRAVNPKFLPWFQIHTHSERQLALLKTNISDSNSNISSILNDNIQLNQSTNTTKSSGLLQLFTPKPQTQEHISSTNYYFKQKLRELFFGHQYDKYPLRNRSNIKTAL